jgi:uncharacterized protein YuzE
MNKLIDTFPLLAREVAKSLRALGRAALARQIEEAVVSRVTFDDSASAGYIYIEPSRALNIVEANIIGVRHGDTITVETEFDAHIDTDNFERVVGIEILAPGVLRSELKSRAGG